MVETEVKSIPNTHLYDHLLSWLGTDTSIVVYNNSKKNTDYFKNSI